MAKKAKEQRKRVYATVVYPESAPPDWLTILRNKHVCAFVSPLHDQDADLDIETGELKQKKPHYHVMVMYDGVKSEDQWAGVRDAIGGVGNEEIESTRGYARYLCHLDNPEKHQYDPGDVTEVGDVDYRDTISNGKQRYIVIKQMITFIEENYEHCRTYRQLMLYAMENEPDWFRSLCDNSSFVIRAYLDSMKSSNL